MTQSTTGPARHIRVALPLTRSGLGLGTGVMTAEGEIPVEFLEPGDRIITHDAGFKPLSHVVAVSAPASSVVRIRPSVLDPEMRGRDMLISARQKVLVSDWRARAMYGQRAVMVEAGKLADGHHIERLTGSEPIRLFQLAFEDSQHLVILAQMGLKVASARLPVKVPA